MKYRILFFALVGMLLFSCSENETPESSVFEITGYWIDAQYTDTVYTYNKSASLKDNQYCFGFEEGGKFVERKNSGWCGTPPIAYADYEGTWVMNDSIIEISVPYWGGMADYKWKIILIDNQQLSLVQIESNHVMEQ